MTTAPSDPLIGQTLDERYVVRSRIARGGMAMVYMASDLRLERRVAVKVMHAHLADEENFIRRFEQEARNAARLAHPNVVNVFDQGHADGRAYLVMEYLPGITLRDLLKQQRRLTPDQAAEIAEAVLSGLAAAHQAGIVHRDLKPENVLLADDGRIKIGDFGLARAVSQNTTTGQALLGTIAYLSPELVTRGIADARSDVYAFGIMMFEMLTGSQPFTGEQPMQIAYQHAHSDVPLPSAHAPGISAELDEIVRWTTQREPEARPRDAGIVLEQLLTLRKASFGLATTQVLPRDEHSISTTPATAVLDEAQRHVLSAPPPSAPHLAASEQDSPASAPPTPIGSARAAALRRSGRGRIAAIAILVLSLAAGGLAYWFAQGPGSLATVPDVAHLSVEDAEASLSQQNLGMELFECTSLDVPEGLAVRSEPDAGSRIERQSTVRVCQSTGPEMISVPTLIGLPLDEAEQTITDAGFVFGEVVEERFSEEDSQTVIAALDAEGDALEETYAEQGRIDLVISVGAVPGVSGMSVDDATAALAEKRLTVDASLGAESHSDDIAEGSVISMIAHTDPLRPGDSVGLEISLGPERFPIPDVAGMTMREAVTELEDAGFSPSTGVPELLWNAVSVENTTPAGGEQVPLGSTVELHFRL